MSKERRYFDIIIVEDPDPSGSFTGRTVAIDREVLERIIQDEIYAQTIWPKERLTLGRIVQLADLLERLTKEQDGES